MTIIRPTIIRPTIIRPTIIRPTIIRRRVGGLLLLLSLGGWLLPIPARADESRAARQLALDIAGSVTPGQSLRLADLPILVFGDRTVKLRFTLRGTPPQAFQNPGLADPGRGPMGTQVVTVDVARLVVHGRSVRRHYLG